MKVLLIIDPHMEFITDMKIIDRITDMSEIFDKILVTKFKKGNNLYEKELGWRFNASEIPDQIQEICDRKFLKQGYDIMKNSHLKNYLLNNQINKVYVSGFESDACVLSSCLSLFDYQIQPIIISDCCDTASSYHSETMNIIKRNIGDHNVIQCQELKGNLGQD